jgi:hypothetical protein
MLIAEAKWLGRVIRELPDDAFPLLNLGSSTEEFRAHTHPWVDREIFAPLRQAGRQVVHVDIKNAPGVDLVCDFTSSEGRAQIAALNAGSILCSNLLEHLPQSPADSALHVMELTSVGMFLIVTAPKDYPPHADPIDNGYRPTPGELASLFPGQVEQAEEVRCRHMAFYFADFGQRWGRFAIRLAAPMIKPRNWAHLVAESGKRASASCVVVHV